MSGSADQRYKYRFGDMYLFILAISKAVLKSFLGITQTSLHLLARDPFKSRDVNERSSPIRSEPPAQVQNIYYLYTLEVQARRGRGEIGRQLYIIYKQTCYQLH